jgi:hypothetical protein
MIYILSHILQQELMIIIKSPAFISQILITQDFKDNLHLEMQMLIVLAYIKNLV